MRAQLERFVLGLRIAPSAPLACTRLSEARIPWGALTRLALSLPAVNWVLTSLSVRQTYRWVSAAPS